MYESAGPPRRLLPPCVCPMNWSRLSASLRGRPIKNTVSDECLHDGKARWTADDPLRPWHSSSAAALSGWTGKGGSPHRTCICNSPPVGSNGTRFLADAANLVIHVVSTSSVTTVDPFCSPAVPATCSGEPAAPPAAPIRRAGAPSDSPGARPPGEAVAETSGRRCADGIGGTGTGGRNTCGGAGRGSSSVARRGSTREATSDSAHGFLSLVVPDFATPRGGSTTPSFGPSSAGLAAHASGWRRSAALDAASPGWYGGAWAAVV